MNKAAAFRAEIHAGKVDGRILVYDDLFTNGPVLNGNSEPINDGDGSRVWHETRARVPWKR